MKTMTEPTNIQKMIHAQRGSGPPCSGHSVFGIRPSIRMRPQGMLAIMAARTQNARIGRVPPGAIRIIGTN
jgi:hypothetical protein